MPNQYTMPNPAERFFTKVRFTDSCWLWQAATIEGYGSFALRGKPIRAHVYAYQLCVGPIAKGLEIDHLCRVHSCVNPDHLEAVTPRTNQRRGMGVSGVNSRKTHCVHGHEFNEDNTYVYRQGWRKCRSCGKDWAQRNLRRPIVTPAGEDPGPSHE